MELTAGVRDVREDRTVFVSSEEELLSTGSSLTWVVSLEDCSSEGPFVSLVVVAGSSFVNIMAGTTDDEEVVEESVEETTTV